LNDALLTNSMMNGRLEVVKAKRHRAGRDIAPSGEGGAARRR